jgi:hypothetical protein
VNAIVAVNVQVPSPDAAPIIADFAEHAIRVAYIARRDANRLPEAEWCDPGIYVLVADDGSHSVYVGKSVDLRSRVMQHKQKNAQVPGWARAVLIKRDTTNGFTSADVGYLEDGYLPSSTRSRESPSSRERQTATRHCPRTCRCR